MGCCCYTPLPATQYRRVQVQKVDGETGYTLWVAQTPEADTANVSATSCDVWSGSLWTISSSSTAEQFYICTFDPDDGSGRTTRATISGVKEFNPGLIACDSNVIVYYRSSNITFPGGLARYDVTFKGVDTTGVLWTTTITGIGDDNSSSYWDANTKFSVVGDKIFYLLPSSTTNYQIRVIDATDGSDSLVCEDEDYTSKESRAPDFAPISETRILIHAGSTGLTVIDDSGTEISQVSISDYNLNTASIFDSEGGLAWITATHNTSNDKSLFSVTSGGSVTTVVDQTDWLAISHSSLLAHVLQVNSDDVYLYQDRFASNRIEYFEGGGGYMEKQSFPAIVDDM